MRDYLPPNWRMLLNSLLVEDKAGGDRLTRYISRNECSCRRYTLLFTSNSAHVISPLLRAAYTHDSVKDFSPISMVAKYPMYLLV
jgi:tripartite-type tricarboxylate transporter receptor subunit TctC